MYPVHYSKKSLEHFRKFNAIEGVKIKNTKNIPFPRFVDSESVYGKMTRPHSSTPTPSKIRRFGHIVVNVSDFQKCSMFKEICCRLVR